MAGVAAKIRIAMIQEPVVMWSCFISALGIAAVIVVPPVRDALYPPKAVVPPKASEVRPPRKLSQRRAALALAAAELSNAADIASIGKPQPSWCGLQRGRRPSPSPCDRL
eukprot:SM000162S02363  [mRNA]  locus=s162:175725:176201:+ [translate_table: standard]